MYTYTYIYIYIYRERERGPGDFAGEPGEPGEPGETLAYNPPTGPQDSLDPKP